MGSKIPRKPPIKEVGRKRPLSDVIDVDMDEPVTSDKLLKPVHYMLLRLLTPNPFFFLLLTAD